MIACFLLIDMKGLQIWRPLSARRVGVGRKNSHGALLGALRGRISGSFTAVCQSSKGCLRKWISNWAAGIGGDL